MRPVQAAQLHARTGVRPSGVVACGEAIYRFIQRVVVQQRNVRREQQAVAIIPRKHGGTGRRQAFNYAF